MQFGSVGRLILEGNSTKIESSLFTGIGALTKLNEVPAMVDQQIRDLREKTAKAQSGNAVIIKESVEPLVANQGENVQTSPDILGILAARGYKIQDGKVSKPK